MSFDKKIQRALKVDGDKLRQLTGEDHGPYFVDEWETCSECGGDGEVLEHKQMPDDPYFYTVRQCFNCGGSGWICK